MTNIIRVVLLPLLIYKEKKLKIKPKEVMVNLPIVLLFSTEDEIPKLCSHFNLFLHGKSKLKYDLLGTLNDQFVGIFYLQRNEEFHQLRNEFVALIEQEEILQHNISGG
jgi:hypothetical protein